MEIDFEIKNETLQEKIHDQHETQSHIFIRNMR